MKNYKIASLASFFSILLFISCDNEPVDPALLVQNPTNNPPVVTTGTFTATIDGESFSAASSVGTYVELPLAGAGKLLSIAGVKSSGEYVAIQIANPAVGTFVADNNTAPETMITLSYRESLSTTDIYTAFDFIGNAPTGILKITSFDLINKKISGTFNFVGHLVTDAVPTKQVTNGVFTDVSFVIN